MYRYNIIQFTKMFCNIISITEILYKIYGEVLPYVMQYMV